jgi:acylphosphatase
MKPISSNEEKTTAFFARVRGRVQGVGFRYSAVQEAQRLKVNGWVRNVSEGDVEVWAEGPEENTDLFLAWLRRGPQYSKVESVVKDERKPQGYSDFGVKF